MHWRGWGRGKKVDRGQYELGVGDKRYKGVEMNWVTGRVGNNGRNGCVSELQGWGGGVHSEERKDHENLYFHPLSEIATRKVLPLSPRIPIVDNYCQRYNMGSEVALNHLEAAKYRNPEINYWGIHCTAPVLARTLLFLSALWSAVIRNHLYHYLVPPNYSFKDIFRPLQS